jgi:hypothetical protein
VPGKEIQLQATTKDRRDQIIFTPISAPDLEAFREICRHKQRTTEFIAGEVLHAWIEEQIDSQAEPAVTREEQRP